MKPSWFRDGIPLDPLIAPMVLFFQNNGIETIGSCQGGINHAYGRPTIDFRATKIRDIDYVARLLKDNKLDTSLQVGLMTGFLGHRYGQAQWIWDYPADDGVIPYKNFVYDRVIQMVDMKEIEPITRDLNEWRRSGYPTIG